MIYYKDSTGQVHAFDDDVDIKVNKVKYNTYLKPKIEKYGLVKLSGLDEANKIIEANKNQDDFIKGIRKKYDREVQSVCTANMFNDINSARNLAQLSTSPLHDIASKITHWELNQQKTFIKLLADAKAGKITLKTSSFDDNFIKFTKNAEQEDFDAGFTSTEGLRSTSIKEE